MESESNTENVQETNKTEPSQTTAETPKSTQESEDSTPFITLVVLIIGITLGLAIYFSYIKENPYVNPKLVDPNTVTEEQRLNGFTTVRLENHFKELKKKYFADYLSQFEGWQILYIKNDEWNNVKWENLDGTIVEHGITYGITYYNEKTIYLNDTHFPRYDSHDETILHEMIHVITPYENHQGEFIEQCKRVSKLSGFDADTIYGYDGLGSVE